MADSKLIWPKRFYAWRGKLYWTYRWVHELYHNETLNEPWEALDEWALFAGFNPADHGWFRWMSVDVSEYKLKSLAVFGFVVGWKHEWQAASLAEPKPAGFDMDGFGMGEF